MIKEEKSKSCWEFWNCPEKIKKKCNAFQENMGQSCWKTVGYIAALNSRCTKLKNGTFEHCRKCPWFKKLNPDFTTKKTQPAAEPQ